MKGDNLRKTIGAGMGKWEKPTEELTKMYYECLPDSPIIEKRQMFGHPCSFINRNMFMGLHQNSLFLRLSAKDREAFLKLDEASLFEPMPGRPMKEYVRVPEWLMKNRKMFDNWIKKSLAYTTELPPKEKKEVKKK